jgi:hypothetical protein
MRKFTFSNLTSFLLSPHQKFVFVITINQVTVILVTTVQFDRFR